ncbi:MAG TPA: glycosyltransferase family 2 protein [Candidatus Methylomirabilis sp.]|nr:glycosyltransferase family 2 protein [Candidatus Methylomirabilis sp.]
MKLLVVLVNYRTPELTVECLRSLAEEGRGLPGVAVVVDNDSRDGSVALIRSTVSAAGWAGWVDVMALPRNGGFAYGANAAIQRARSSSDPPEFVLLLNPDTMVRPGALEALLDFMGARPDASIVGSRLEDMDGIPQRSAFRFHTVWSELEATLRVGLLSRLLARHVAAPPVPDAPCRTDWVSGASLLIRSRVFDVIGLLDETYFLYYEDTDFCLRAARAGFSCWYVPTSRVVHLRGRATGLDWKTPIGRVPSYWFESRRRYFVKNHGTAYAAVADLAWLVGTLGRRLRRVLDRQRHVDPPRFVGDFLEHSVFIQAGRR